MSNTWTCPSCTYDNKERAKCEVCDTSRPAPARRAVSRMPASGPALAASAAASATTAVLPRPGGVINLAEDSGSDEDTTTAVASTRKPAPGTRPFGVSIDVNVTRLAPAPKSATATAAAPTRKPAAPSLPAPAVHPPAPRIVTSTAAAAASGEDPALISLHERVGGKVYDRILASDFAKCYAQQDHAIPREGFQDLASHFKPEFLEYADEGFINGVKTPFQALQPSHLASFLHYRTNTSGVYGCAVCAPFDEVAKFVSGEMDMSSLDLSAKGRKRMEQVREVAAVALDIVKQFCDENGLDPSTHYVTFEYGGLTANQAINNGDERLSRLLQHFHGSLSVRVLTTRPTSCRGKLVA